MNGDAEETKDQFPIRELSARTQVNTVTLRAWERRYGLLKPARTAKGHRLYSDEDVSKIERILALVARGVPLGKVKPLLQEDVDVDLPSPSDDSGVWPKAAEALINAAKAYSSNKVEHLLHDTFANYPAPICREHLIEPVFIDLKGQMDDGAAYGFLESELIRYSALRLNNKTTPKGKPTTVVLIAGDQAPIWRLVLMALELTDLKFSVQLLYRSFSLGAGIELAIKLNHAYTVFYQDGIWKSAEKKQVGDALLLNDHLLMCGTAPTLTELTTQGRIFSDTQDCISGLLEKTKNTKV